MSEIASFRRLQEGLEQVLAQTTDVAEVLAATRAKLRQLEGVEAQWQDVQQEISAAIAAARDESSRREGEWDQARSRAERLLEDTERRSQEHDAEMKERWRGYEETHNEALADLRQALQELETRKAEIWAELSRRQAAATTAMNQRLERTRQDTEASLLDLARAQTGHRSEMEAQLQQGWEEQEGVNAQVKEQLSMLLTGVNGTRDSVDSLRAALDQLGAHQANALDAAIEQVRGEAEAEIKLAQKQCEELGQKVRRLQQILAVAAFMIAVILLSGGSLF